MTGVIRYTPITSLYPKRYKLEITCPRCATRHELADPKPTGALITIVCHDCEAPLRGRFEAKDGKEDSSWP